MSLFRNTCTDLSIFNLIILFKYFSIIIIIVVVVVVVVIIIIINFTHIYHYNYYYYLLNLLTSKFCRERWKVHGHIEIEIGKMRFPWI